MAKNKNNQAKKSKKSKSVQGTDMIDDVGAVSATDMTGSMPFNNNKTQAANTDGVTNYQAKAKGKN